MIKAIGCQGQDMKIQTERGVKVINGHLPPETLAAMDIKTVRYDGHFNDGQEVICDINRLVDMRHGRLWVKCHPIDNIYAGFHIDPSYLI